MNQPRILVALPTTHPDMPCVDQILDGTSPCSGSIGSIVRLAGYLAEAGWQPCLSSSTESRSTKFRSIDHTSVKAGEFDLLVVNQTHWNGEALTFGREAISRTILWLQNQTPWAFVNEFLKSGGYRVVCPSFYHANIYRALPQWRSKVDVIYNSTCPVFRPMVTATPKKRLLFIGAISPSKGFAELMEVWSYLARKVAKLHLAIAGSISLHTNVSASVGSLGVADRAFEAEHIVPWLKSLPPDYKPEFLGSLGPVELRKEIAGSWAVIVNPSWSSPETFCVAAVEAQLCDRSVFSLAAGGLNETVYRGEFATLTPKRGIDSLSERILDGLNSMEAVRENGRLAGEFVRAKFGDSFIPDSWLKLLSGQRNSLVLPKTWSSTDDVVKDLLRWTHTSKFAGR